MKVLDFQWSNYRVCPFGKSRAIQCSKCGCIKAGKAVLQGRNGSDMVFTCLGNNCGNVTHTELNKEFRKVDPGEVGEWYVCTVVLRASTYAAATASASASVQNVV